MMLYQVYDSAEAATISLVWWSEAHPFYHCSPRWPSLAYQNADGTPRKPVIYTPEQRDIYVSGCHGRFETYDDMYYRIYPHYFTLPRELMREDIDRGAQPLDEFDQPAREPVELTLDAQMFVAGEAVEWTEDIQWPDRDLEFGLLFRFPSTEAATIAKMWGFGTTEYGAPRFGALDHPKVTELMKKLLEGTT